MFNALDTKSTNRAGIASSVVINLSLLALSILFGAAVHRVTRPQVLTQLVMPQLKMVKLRPTVMTAHKGGHADNAPALMTVGVTHVQCASVQPTAPVMVARLDTPSVIELPQANTHATLAPQAHTGVFGAAPSAGGSGNGRGVVAGAGFGMGSGSGEGRGTGNKMVRAGFDVQPAAVPVPVVTVKPTVVPPVVLSKLRPIYTDAARAAHVEGEVILQVRLTSAGQVEVLQVVSGLPLGLTESAIRSAQGLRFKPATRDGQAVDHVTIVRVAFQLG